MKLLFDANLSYKLVRRLSDLVDEATHVAVVGLGSASDHDIWDHARSHGYTIVTKDEDFNSLSQVEGHPPKVIWLRIGNLATTEVEQVLRRNFVAIAELHRQDVGLIVVE